MAELAQLARPDEVLLVAQGTPDDADGFFRERWPEARVVSDERRDLYVAFGLRRVSLLRMFSPKVFLAAWRHRRHGVGKVVGDPFVLPGTFVLESGVVRFAHRGTHAADDPDWNEVVDLVRASRSASR
ncbi:MAG: peroxiredoxin-like family protein [Planctomycetota bacterium]